MFDEMRKPIPEGLQRGKFSRRKSIERLDQIIRLGGAVGEGYSCFKLGAQQQRRRAFLNRNNLRWDDLDIDTRADTATYSYYGKLINKECKEKKIPSPYPGGIGWAFRNTKDRVWTVNTLIYLLVQRRTSEQFILNMRDVIDILHDRVNKGEAKIKKLTEIIAEKDKKIADLNPEKEIKRKTEAFHARMEVFKQREESLQKQIEALKKKEQQMEMSIKKLTKDLAITKKGKTDMERKNWVVLNQKRIQEAQYKNIQQRLTSKLDQAFDGTKSNLGISQIGEFPLLETERAKRRRRRKDQKNNTRQFVEEFIEEQNQNHIVDLQKIIAENELLGRQMDILVQRLDDEESECSSATSTSAVDNNQDGETREGLSVFDFYFSKLKEIFEQYAPEAERDIPMLLGSFPNREHLVYTKVCSKFGITPVTKYTGVTVRGSVCVQNLSDSDMSIPKEKVSLKINTGAKIRRLSMRGEPSPSWVDDDDMDGLSVELDKGWGFAVSHYAKYGDEPLIERRGSLLLN